MALRIQFDLEDEELEHFRNLMQSVCARTDCQNREQIIDAACEQAARLRATHAPRYVLERLETVDLLVAMSRDSEWQLPALESDRVSYALAYFAESGDLIPDNVPVLGYMDDAIMIELVAQELSHEISAYQDFTTFRTEETARRNATGKHEDPVTRNDWLDAKRRELQQRMRQESSRLRSLFSVFSAT